MQKRLWQDACQKKRFSWFSDWSPKVQKRVDLVDLVKSFQSFKRVFSIYVYLLANIGFDTAENGPLKVCQQLAKS